MFRASTIAVLAALWLAASAASANPLPREAVPAALKPWLPWVLHDVPTAACPRPHQSPDERICVWPARLDLELGATGARFRLAVTVYGASATVVLPGDADAWPLAVEANGRAIAVTVAQDRPIAALPAGEHVISGRFEWSRLPQSLRVPLDVATVHVQGGKAGAVPDSEGRLPLADAPLADQAAAIKDAVTIRRFRLIDDDVPMRVTTRIDLEIAGRPRPLVLAAALLPEFVPLAIASALPARLDAAGALQVQARPGRWSIEVTGRRMGPVDVLALPKNDDDSTEVWSFIGREALRAVTITGVPSVDTKQVPMPEAWRRYPAYAVSGGETMRFDTLRRGASGRPRDPLALTRTLWIDFDGGGYTARDRIQGTLGQSVRLQADTAQQVGRIVANGIDQVVTRTGDKAGPTGVELRPGPIDLRADSRIPARTRTLAASGWQHDFASANVTVNLPPGWQLLHARGSDSVQGSWTGRWTLYDFFFVLLAALAAGRLFGWTTGAVTLVGLGLAWHTDAPGGAWIVLLALIAAARYAPEGRMRRGLNVLRWITLAVIAILLVPHAVDSIRAALYASLDGPRAGAVVARGEPSEMHRDNARLDESNRADAAPESPVRQEGRVSGGATPAPARAVPPASSGLPYPSSQVAKTNVVDPTQKVQTGPGIPTWQWRQATLGWQGPVAAAQSIDLWLLAPWQNALMHVLRVVLLGWLLWIFCDRPRPRWDRFAAPAMLLAVALAMPAHDATAQDAIPAGETLDALRAKLTAAPACMPTCADVARLAIDAAGNRIALRVEVHAAAEVAVPLPAPTSQWRTGQVLLDGRAAATRRGADGVPWIVVPAGVHQVVLEADVGASPSVQLTLPMPPRRVQSTLSGWSLDGLDDRGRANGALQLSRVTPAAGPRNAASVSDATIDRDTLPPFVVIERTLRIGQTWTIETQITRRGPSRAPAVVRVPLAGGESVTAADVKIDGDTAIVTLAGGSASFESTLREAPDLRLTAARAANQIEQWALDIGPQWHFDASGLPAVDPSAGMALPTWRPWPGETLTLAITKPAPIEGATLTIDGAGLELRPGRNASDVALALVLRSSQGGPHTIRMPEGADLQTVTINDRPQPVRAEGRDVRIPLAPGTQRVRMQWREPTGMAMRYATPGVELGAQGVNASLRVAVPQDRWVLAVGGVGIGPAVLYWGTLIVVAAIAFALARSRLTPLGLGAWLLLGVGLTQSSVLGASVVVAWFLAFELRRRVGETLRPLLFNALQIVLVLLTLAAFGVLLDALREGLLGAPDMQISGNGSSAQSLAWFQDRFGPELPRAWVVSVPLLIYNVLMLAWALWLAWSVLRWARWAWSAWNGGGIWRAFPRRAKAQAAEQAPESPPASV